MFMALVMLVIFGIPATGCITAGVFLVRNRMSESITSVGAILGVLAISFGGNSRDDRLIRICNAGAWAT